MNLGGRRREISERGLVEVKIKLPEDMLMWLEDIAKARDETIDEVLWWTLGTLQNLYDRWMRAKRLKLEKLHNSGGRLGRG